MATSSIIENIRVNNPQFLEDYAEFIEESEKNYHPSTEDDRSGVITDLDETIDFMRKALGKKGIIL